MISQEKYPKEVNLIDGSKVALRPMVESDLEKSFNFFKGLPEDVRLYLRVDVTQKDIVKRRMQDDDLFQFHRLVAIDKGEIIADASICREIYNWKRHLGEIRVIIHPNYQKKGLGTVLIQELFSVANLLGIDILYSYILEEQQGALHILSKLGFKKEIVKKGHVKDFQGKKHDLIVMSCNLMETLPSEEEYLTADTTLPVKKYPKEVELNDSNKLTIRPMVATDLERSYSFFQELPEDIRLYLKVDVTKKDVVKRRMKQDDLRQHHRLVALDNDKIVADATIYREIYNWKKHLGEIRVIISPKYHRKGLGTILIHELYVMANLLGIEILYAHIMEVQQSALTVFSKLGFKQEIVKRGHTKDLHGQKHDLIVMSCNLAELWHQWEMLILDMDTGRG